MPSDVEFFFDCGSPWTYIAFENICRLREEIPFNLIWRPILVGGVFDAVNDSVYHSRANPVPAKEKYLAKDLQDWAKFAGLSLVFPPRVFPARSAKAMRGCLLAGSMGRMPAFARAVFEAYWRDNRDIADSETLETICQALDLDARTFLGSLETPEIKQALRNNTAELVARGGFGSPTMFVDGNDMYFGNDRLLLVRHALQIGTVRRRRPIAE